MVELGVAGSDSLGAAACSLDAMARGCGADGLGRLGVGLIRLWI